MILNCLSTTEDFSEIFSDHSVLRAMLDFEVALARAQVSLHLIPERAAEAIAAAAHDVAAIDVAAIAREAFETATPAIPFVKQLKARVQDINAEAATYVHWGTTSQDVCDTAMSLLLQKAQPVLKKSQDAIAAKLAELSNLHREMPMLARTLLQPAPPIPFGLKVAGWYAGANHSWKSLQDAFNRSIQLQFGGPNGTLAAFGQQGPAIAAALSSALGLPVPRAPWHTRRDGLAALVCAAAIYTGSLAKIARDISLLMQHEVGEVAERGGGSSSMPHKRNPSGCVVVLAAAARLPGLAASMLTAMVQEQDRGAGGWQAESMILSDAIQTTGAAAASMANVLDGLTVDPARMLANLESMRGIMEVGLDDPGSAELFRRSLLEE